MSWSLVVYCHKSKEYEDVYPSTWIDGDNLRLPKNGIKRAISEYESPKEDWCRYKIKRTKYTNGEIEIAVLIKVVFYWNF